MGKIIFAYTDRCIEKPGAKYKKKKETNKIISHTYEASNDESTHHSLCMWMAA